MRHESWGAVKDSRTCVHLCVLIIFNGRCRDGKRRKSGMEGWRNWEREVTGRMKKRKQTCFLILLILFLMVRTGWGVIARGRANGVIHPSVTVQQPWNTATIRDNRRVQYRERGQEPSWSSTQITQGHNMTRKVTTNGGRTGKSKERDERVRKASRMIWQTLCWHVRNKAHV